MMYESKRKGAIMTSCSEWPMRARAACGCLVIAAAAIAGPWSAAWAASGYETRAKAALLMEAGTGAVLYQQNADQLLPPASISKLMTLAVVFRALKKGRLD